MSRTKPTEIETVGLAVRCDRCGAEPNLWCRAPSGRYARWLHSARTNVAYELWRYAYCSGYSDALQLLQYEIDRAGSSRWDLPKPVTVAALSERMEDVRVLYADYAAVASAQLLERSMP